MKFPKLEQVRSMAIVGATGLVGRELLEIFAEYKVAIPDIRLLASEDSAGTSIETGGREYPVEALTESRLGGAEVCFFSTPEAITKDWVPKALKAGALVVDDSSVFRLQKDVPLVVPEVNAHVLRDFPGQLVSTPNCSTTPLVLALKPLEDAYGLKRVVVSTYQSVSGAGRKAFDELSDQSVKLLNGVAAEAQVFSHRIAFNCLPMIGKAKESGYSSEEDKIIQETRKILELSELPITATAVRVPTFCGHGLSVNVEFEKDFDRIEVIREILDSMPGLKMLDRPEADVYPTNVECIGSDPCFIGRLRRDFSVKSGVNFWIIADNLRKGAALNGLQIIDTLYNYRTMA